jgi:hypothetical protein
MRVWQEFYCTKSGGGCGKYIRVKLNMALNHTVKIICPLCKHEHQRVIEEGVIKEQGRFDNKPIEEVCPPKSACSDKPYTKQMAEIKKGKSSKNERDAAVIKGEEDVARHFLKELWFGKFGG